MIFSLYILLFFFHSSFCSFFLHNIQISWIGFCCKRRNESIVYGTALPAWRVCGGVVCSLLTFSLSARWQKNTAQFLWAIFIFFAIRHFQSNILVLMCYNHSAMKHIPATYTDRIVLDPAIRWLRTFFFIVWLALHTMSRLHTMSGVCTQCQLVIEGRNERQHMCFFTFY